MVYNINIGYLYTVRIGSSLKPWGSIPNRSVDYGFLIFQSGTEPRIQKTNPNLSDWTGLDRITDFADSLLSPTDQHYILRNFLFEKIIWLQFSKNTFQKTFPKLIYPFTQLKGSVVLTHTSTRPGGG